MALIRQMSVMVRTTITGNTHSTHTHTHLSILPFSSCNFCSLILFFPFSYITLSLQYYLVELCNTVFDHWWYKSLPYSIAHTLLSYFHSFLLRLRASSSQSSSPNYHLFSLSLTWLPLYSWSHSAHSSSPPFLWLLPHTVFSPLKSHDVSLPSV